MVSKREPWHINGYILLNRALVRLAERARGLNPNGKEYRQIADAIGALVECGRLIRQECREKGGR